MWPCFLPVGVCTISALPDQLLPLSSAESVIVHGQGRGPASTMQARLHPENSRATKQHEFDSLDHFME